MPPLKAKKVKTATMQEQPPSAAHTLGESAEKDIERLVNDLNKKFGANTITKGVPASTSKEIRRIPTGSMSLDIDLNGGIPVGRYIEISGGLSTSKTTQSLHIIREAQKMGFVCAYIDAEETTDENYFRQLGVDYENLLYSNPNSTEEATQIILDMQKSGIVHLAVLDSIAALSPNAEMKTDMDETTRMMIQPSLLNEFFRKYTMNNNTLKRDKKQSFTLICLNQLRERPTQWGDNEYSPGGRGKGFVATIDIRLRRGDWIIEGKGEDREIVGQVIKYKIEKNKLGRRMTSGEFDFYFSKNAADIEPGYNDVFKEIIVCAVEWGVIERTGSWFKYGSQKYQGQESLVSAFRKDPSLVGTLKAQILALSSKE